MAVASGSWTILRVLAAERKPLYIKWIEQIHPVDGSPLAITSDWDLL